MRNVPHVFWSVAIVFLFILSCTIRDENGNPAAPGIDAVQPVDVSITPSLFASPESAYVQPGDTLGIRVRVFADSGTDSMKPIASFRVTARSNRGSIIEDSLLTDADGRARFLFTSTESGNTEFTVEGNNVRQTIRFEVTTTPVRVQKLLQAMPGASIIKADGVDKTTISVSVLNTFRNPIVGECVQFITSAGIIVGGGSGCNSSGQSVTGSDGIARATLISSNINDTAFITAYLVSDQSLSDEVEVVFQGMSISLNASKSNLKRGDTTVITARLANASSLPVATSPLKTPWTYS